MRAGNPKLFGSSTRSRILVAITLLRESYVAELATVLELSQPTVFRVVDALERDGVLNSRQVGRTRTVSLNPRMYGIGDLEAFLRKYAKGTDVEGRISTLRRRPRRRPTSPAMPISS